MNEYIVAEVSKNWIKGESGTRFLICQMFENLIEQNLQRGYRLDSWQLHRVVVRPDELNETIIAVFHRNQGMA